jgi:hypothetical protein
LQKCAFFDNNVNARVPVLWWGQRTQIVRLKVIASKAEQEQLDEKHHVDFDGLWAEEYVISSVLNKKTFASVHQQRPLIKQLNIPLNEESPAIASRGQYLHGGISD